MQMRFGKYKNYDIPNIPISYLKWLLETIDPVDIDKDLYKAMSERIQNSQKGFIGVIKTHSRLEIWIRILLTRYSIVLQASNDVII